MGAQEGTIIYPSLQCLLGAHTYCILVLPPSLIIFPTLLLPPFLPFPRYPPATGPLSPPQFAGKISASSPIPKGCNFVPGKTRVFGASQGAFAERWVTSSTRRGIGIGNGCLALYPERCC